MDPLSVEGYLMRTIQSLASIHDRTTARLHEQRSQGLEAVPWEYYEATVDGHLEVILRVQNICSSLMSYIAWQATEDEARDNTLRLVVDENRRMSALIEEYDRRLSLLDPQVPTMDRVRLRLAGWVAPSR